LRLRRLLHAAGLRYRVDYRIKLDAITVRPDIVFTHARVVVFVDGCFWHRCPEHGRMPSDPNGYWEAKLNANVIRDGVQRDALKAAGWAVVRAWEHESALDAFQMVITALGGTKSRP
jgi:DNA mismatch endonuclease (patch repair protein)